MSSFGYSLPLYKQQGWSDSDIQGTIFPYLQFTVAFTTFIFLIEIYLDFRQYLKFSNNKGIPKELKDHVKGETFTKAIAYRKDLFAFKIIEAIFSFVFSITFLVCGYLPYLWDVAVHMANYFQIVGDSHSPLYNEVVITWLFLMIFTIIDTVTNLPFSLYSTFVIEEKHGFNKTTLALYFQDKLMSLGLMIGFSIPLLPAMIWIIRKGGPHFYFYIWLFLCIVSVILMTIYPVLIAPLFNKYTKLEEGEVKTAIEDLAKSVDFPLTNLFSVDGSKRSAHSNAYFYGFFKNKRIVLYDTLLKQVDIEELLAILGHEIGHWKLWHTIQGFLISQVYTFILFWTFSFVQSTPPLFLSFGFAYHDPMPIFIGLILFTQTFWGPVDKVCCCFLPFSFFCLLLFFYLRS
jgi:STE24 endopeptidase